MKQMTLEIDIIQMAVNEFVACYWEPFKGYKIEESGIDAREAVAKLLKTLSKVI